MSTTTLDLDTIYEYGIGRRIIIYNQRVVISADSWHGITELILDSSHAHDMSASYTWQQTDEQDDTADANVDDLWTKEAFSSTQYMQSSLRTSKLLSQPAKQLTCSL